MQSKKQCKYQESIQANTHDTTWESDKNTIKHHIQESQEASPFPTGDHKAAIKQEKHET